LFHHLLHSKNKKYFKAPFLVLHFVTNRGLVSVNGRTTIPSEEFELIANLTHWELAVKLTVGSFWGYSVNSQWSHKMTYTVSLLWVCNSHHKLAVICEIIPVSSMCMLAVRSLCVGLLWTHHVSSLWSHCLPHGEIFWLSSLWPWCLTG